MISLFFVLNATVSIIELFGILGWFVVLEALIYLILYGILRYTIYVKKVRRETLSLVSDMLQSSNILAANAAVMVVFWTYDNLNTQLNPKTSEEGSK